MIAVRPKQAESNRSTPPTAVGVDNGHGLLKLAIGADSSQMKVRCPSKFKEVREDHWTTPHQSTAVHSTTATGMLRR
jgi:hypothetical protein